MASTRIGGADVTTAHYARFAASLVGGVCASLVGGVAMAAVMVVAFTTLRHTGLWYALKPIGAFLYGDRMFTMPTTGMYVAATAFHFGVCVVWGIVFAFAATLLRADKSVGGALVLGIVIGLASQIIDINLVTPALMDSLWGDDLWTAAVPPAYSWLGHVAFGLCFALAPLVFRGLWVRWSGRPDVEWNDPRIH